jgi:DNA excision repair protein ERCC-6
MNHWQVQFEEWFSVLPVFVLHTSQLVHYASHQDMIQAAFRTNGSVVITTYESARAYSNLLLDLEWGYVVLDEGHKIRNPDAEITQMCKQFLTTHKLILTGAPVQNNLIELWSLFDFVYPGKLGTLPIFEQEFQDPIHRGGFTNATVTQARTAYKCALTLKNLIAPYILRRTKKDVAKHLPKKTEQVLLCDLTPYQKDVYNDSIGSSDIHGVISRKHTNLFGAITTLRKVCNHPHLLRLEVGSNGVLRPPLNFPEYGACELSGKMLVLQQILKSWHQQKHRVLLFTQTRQMLFILLKFIQMEGYEYLTLDGSTPVGRRPALIDEYNNSPEIFLFVLTTRAGGLGINLTGADRVILFDPDWNPATDMQAQERAYRLGQTKPVTIYRLVSRGTIEEKVYHRQIFKQMLTNKILTIPKQARFF